MTSRTPGVGEQAPDFTLDTTSGKPVTLSSFRGNKNVLVAFFPMAFTSTCQAELCGFSDDYADFAARDVEVIAISADMVPSLKAFKEKNNMSVELASDLRRDVARAYGVLNDEKYFANRSYFLIDKTGKLRWSHVEAKNGERRQNPEILAQIEKLAA
ncbi:MAG TPA: redoxin domain-containing protein [Gemmatimonadaceae bacterium]|nr:redoxin domain-containing protein [Gemmatimonadaceae bacterium]